VGRTFYLKGGGFMDLSALEAQRREAKQKLTRLELSIKETECQIKSIEDELELAVIASIKIGKVRSRLEEGRRLKKEQAKRRGKKQPKFSKEQQELMATFEAVNGIDSQLKYADSCVSSAKSDSNVKMHKMQRLHDKLDQFRTELGSLQDRYERNLRAYNHADGCLTFAKEPWRFGVPWPYRRAAVCKVSPEDVNRFFIIWGGKTRKDIDNEHNGHAHYTFYRNEQGDWTADWFRRPPVLLFQYALARMYDKWLKLLKRC
jgi:hypothetical protein